MLHRMILLYRWKLGLTTIQVVLTEDSNYVCDTQQTMPQKSNRLPVSSSVIDLHLTLREHRPATGVGSVEEACPSSVPSRLSGLGSAVSGPRYKRF